MKKLFLLLGVSVISLAAFSQKFSFSKGNVTSGKISSARAYEDFLIGKIAITDESGTEYSFVKAGFSEKPVGGKTISFTLTATTFPEEVRGDIARASQKGTIYTFTNVVVKDRNGKEYTIPMVKYEFAGLNGN